MSEGIQLTEPPRVSSGATAPTKRKPVEGKDALLTGRTSAPLDTKVSSPHKGDRASCGYASLALQPNCHNPSIPCNALLSKACTFCVLTPLMPKGRCQLGVSEGMFECCCLHRPTSSVRCCFSYTPLLSILGVILLIVGTILYGHEVRASQLMLLQFTHSPAQVQQLILLACASVTELCLVRRRVRQGGPFGAC